MTDNGCKREMTFEEERLAYNAKLKELLFAEDEYPGDSLLKCILRDSQRILGKATAEIGALHMNIINRQSEYVILNQNYEHIKELLEAEKATVKRANERFFDKNQKLQKAKEEIERLRELFSAVLFWASEVVNDDEEFHDVLIRCGFTEEEIDIYKK